MKARLILTVAIAALVIHAPFGFAAATFESNSSGDWDDTGTTTWDCVAGDCDHDFPVLGDTATIKAGHTIDVDSLAQGVDNLTIEQGATRGLLNIQPGGTLRIDVGLTMETHATNQDAEIHFSGTTGDPGLLQIGGNLTAAGPIRVTGAAGGSISSVVATDTFTFQDIVYVTSGDLTLSAEFDLDGSADGRLRVDGANTLTIQTNGPVAGTSGRFETTVAGAKIVFQSGTGVTWSTGAGTDGPYFDVQAGEMEFNDTFGDEAAFRQQAGTVNVAAAKKFTANEAWVNP